MKELSEKLKTLVVFRELLNDEIIKKIIGLACDFSTEKYCDLCCAVFNAGANLSDYVLKITLENENCYIKGVSQKAPVSAEIEKSVKRELNILQRVSALSSAEIKSKLGANDLPDWESASRDFEKEYADMASNVYSRGYGVYASYYSFILDGGKLTPIKNPDPVRLTELSGYEAERKLVIDNSLALLDGRPAANVLLYGDGGTGKSSSVKAILNEYRSKGLRLIELGKSQLRYIPRIMDMLNGNPLKFIIFIDDLSFSENDDDYAALKAALEGSVAAKSSNAVIYATSNRKHLIKESFSDREGDEIHISDTIEELASLSQRFGLTVTFQKPDKRRYIEVIKALAVTYGIRRDESELIADAEKFALERGGRSPRVAKQFIEFVKADEMLQDTFKK